jgi:CrcB protein
MTPETLGLIAILGALGALLRYVVGHTLARYAQGTLAIVVVNLAGSALAGALAALPDSALTLALLVGLCGSLTTFSTVATQLIPGTRGASRTAWIALALTHAVGSVVFAWGAFTLVSSLG